MPWFNLLPRRPASFSARFAIVLGILGVFIAAASAALPLSQVASTTRQNALDRANDRAAVAHNVLSSQQQSLVTFVRGVAEQLSPSAGAPLDEAALTSFLVQLSQQSDTTDVIAVVRAEGVIAVRGGMVLGTASPSAWLARVDPGAAGVIADPDGRPWLAQGATISDAGSAALVARPIDTDLLGRLSGQLGAGPDATDLAVVRSGRYAVPATVAGVHLDSGAALTGPVLDAVRGGVPAITSLQDHDVAIATTQLGNGFSLVALTPVGATAGFTNSVAWPVVIVAAAVILLALLLVYIVVEHDLQRPLRRLDRAVEALGREEFDAPVPTDAGDAIGRVGASFDAMRRQLRTVLRTAEARADVALELSSAEPLPAALDRACALLRTTTGSSSALIALRGEVDAVVHQSPAAHIRDAALLLRGDGPLATGSRLARLEPVLLSAAPGSIEAEAGMRTLCVAPLLVGGRSLGAVALADKPGGFVAADQQLLVAVAEQAAVSVERDRLLAQARHQAITDGLTGLHNYRFLVDYIDQQLAVAERSGAPLAVLMLDLDHFKRINDAHGLKAGDEALRLFAATLQNVVRRSDLAARYGGEEFAVVMAGTDSAEAELVAEKIRRVVGGMRVPSNSDGERITVSIGGAAYPESATSTGDLIAAADDALYRAKQSGRDQVRFAVEAPGGVAGPALRRDGRARPRRR